MLALLVTAWYAGCGRSVAGGWWHPRGWMLPPSATAPAKTPPSHVIPHSPSMPPPPRPPPPSPPTGAPLEWAKGQGCPVLTTSSQQKRAREQASRLAGLERCCSFWRGKMVGHWRREWWYWWNGGSRGCRPTGGGRLPCYWPPPPPPSPGPLAQGRTSETEWRARLVWRPLQRDWGARLTLSQTSQSAAAAENQPPLRSWRPITHIHLPHYARPSLACYHFVVEAPRRKAQCRLHSENLQKKSLYFLLPHWRE